ncbi:MAG: hypothetical protein M1826_004894 [Phylliscum demangeonii]|nr:MAG: hypothetical protein M1826_004894 [Phylliscum demangeonii]
MPPAPPDHRLGLPFTTRLPASAASAALIGLSFGYAHGARSAGLLFRAENAHRLPTTATEWYGYHKFKNYAVLQAGLKEGFLMAGRFGLLVGGFVTAEQAVDRVRGRADAWSTVIASLTVTGLFTLRHLHPPKVATRTARLGLLFGLVFGVLQDALMLGRGHRVDYVDYILGRRPDRITGAAAGETGDDRPIDA